MKLEEFVFTLKRLIPKTNELSDLCFGVVTSISPLAIKLDNKFIIQEQFLILGAMVKQTIIKVPVDHDYEHLHVVPEHTTEMGGNPAHTHAVLPFNTEKAHPEIMLWRGLEVGDKVRLLRCFSGQRYYILERQEGITNDPNTN